MGNGWSGTGVFGGRCARHTVSCSTLLSPSNFKKRGARGVELRVVQVSLSPSRLRQLVKVRALVRESVLEKLATPKRDAALRHF
jgi:hypothetical protein